MSNLLIIRGVYPGLNEEHLDYIAVKLEEFFGVNF